VVQSLLWQDRLKFVALLLQGESAIDAHEHAGFARDDCNAARLRANPKVVERLTELQNQVAAETQVTIQGLLNELEAVRQKATDLKQLSAAVKAISEKAKISGLMVQRVEIGPAHSFDSCDSTEEVVDSLIRMTLNHYHDFRPEDRRALIEMQERHSAQTQAFIEAIKKRPVLTGTYVTTPPKRLTNGNSRSANRQVQFNPDSDPQ
jgi:hypothetical protein